MKKKDYIIIAVILLVGLGLFFGLKSYLDKNYEKKEDSSSEVEKEKNKIDDATINKLFDSLIVDENNIQSLYFTKKVTSTDNDYNFIAFNLRLYLSDNNIIYGGKIEDDGFGGGYVVYKLNKDILSKYINNKYDTTVKYDLPVSENIYDGIRFEGTTNLLSRSNEWVLRLNAAGSGTNRLEQKLINYETEDDNLIIYSKIVSCNSELGGYSCGSLVNPSGTGMSVFNKVIDCISSQMASSYESTVNICPFSSLEEATKYTLNNYDDKLYKYKHTFKKTGDNYYWYSSEIVSES